MPKEKHMKTGQTEKDAEMLPEYDLSDKKGIRGKYHGAYQHGHSVKVRQEDDTIVTHYFTLEDGAVLLAPDVREYFPDSESVNQALRILISAIPHKSLA